MIQPDLIQRQHDYEDFKINLVFMYKVIKIKSHIMQIWYAVELNAVVVYHQISE